jgi:hypothetical protein
MCRQGLITDEERESVTEDATGGWAKIEKKLMRDASKMIKTMPIYTKWLTKVRGVGDTLATQFVALIQPISDFDNVAKLWAYAGYAVSDGEAVRRRLGVKSNWNPELKKLGFQLGDCFIKAGGAYRQLYDNYKARDRAAHPEPIIKTDGKGRAMKTREGKAWRLYTDGHMHARARRYAVKIFLSHLWQAWRELEGLPVRGPYAVEYLGHTTVLSPWSFIEADEEEGAA